MTQPETPPSSAPIVALSPEISAEEALRLILATQCEALDARLAQIMDSDDPEGPHRARVALRRLRAALGAFDPILDPDTARALHKELRRLFRRLGKLRDADVQAALTADPAHAAEAAAQRSAIRDRLRRGHELLLGTNLRVLFLGKSWRRKGSRARERRHAPVGDLATQALDRAWAASLDHGGAIPDMAEIDRHELRKDLKTLRYVAEFFAPLWPGPAQDKFLTEMRDLQDALGLLNDLRLVAGAPTAAPRAQAAAEALQEAQDRWRQLRRAGPWWR